MGEQSERLIVRGYGSIGDIDYDTGTTCKALKDGALLVTEPSGRVTMWPAGLWSGWQMTTPPPKRFIGVDVVRDVISDEQIGIAISIGDAQFFISARQDLWPGIRKGKFPRPESGKAILEPLFLLECKEGDTG